MDEQGSVVSGDKKIVSSLFQNVQTGCGPKPTSYSVGTESIWNFKNLFLQAYTFWSIISFCKLNDVLVVPTSIFDTVRSTSEQWLPDSLENSDCFMNFLKYILFVVIIAVRHRRLQHNGRSYMSPKIKSTGFNSGEEAGQALMPPRPIRFSETHFSWMFELQEGNVFDQHHAWTIKESYPTDSHLGKTLKRRFISGYRSKLP